MNQNDFKNYARDFLIHLVREKEQLKGISQYNFYYGASDYKVYKEAKYENAFKIQGFTTQEAAVISTANTSVISKENRKNEDAIKVTKADTFFAFICQFSNGIRFLSSTMKENAKRKEFGCLAVKVENNFGTKKESATINKSREDESYAFKQCVLFSYQNIGLGNVGHFSIICFQCSSIKYRVNLINAKGQSVGNTTLESQ